MDLSNVERLVRAGRKVDAIRELRALTGLGLQDSHDLVEAFIDTGTWTQVTIAATPVALSASSGAAAGAHADPKVAGSEKRRKIEAQIRQGNTLIAVKLLRDALGVSVKEAEGMVQRYREVKAWTPAIQTRLDAVVAGKLEEDEVNLRSHLAWVYRRPVEPDLVVSCLRGQYRGRVVLVGSRTWIFGKHGRAWRVEITFPHAHVQEATLATPPAGAEIHLRVAHLPVRISGMTLAEARTLLARYRSGR